MTVRLWCCQTCRSVEAWPDGEAPEGCEYEGCDGHMVELRESSGALMLFRTED